MMKRNAFLIFTFVALATSVADAAIVSRSASRSSGARAPTMAVNVNNSPQPTQTTQSVQSIPVDTPVYENSQPLVIYTAPVATNVATPEPIDFGPIENKTSQFDTILNNASTVNADTAASSLAEMVRAQRAALDATSISTTKTNSTAQINACDTSLRSCMTDKCGKNFAKCSSDNDTLFGTKLDSCRRNLPCNANEFKLFSAEIKADRALAIKLNSFNDILDCGNEYDQCILTQCGTTYAKCLGKLDGDTAISKCSSIANRCREMDSGLPNRAMSVFATLRQNAEKQIVSDENQLYTMRDNMRSICGRIGAMFDDRSLDCVYTVNFYAGDEHTLYASKKLYAGSTFDCTPNWFGIDVTTFMDNAYRRTREQTSASSAMLGSGVGMAVGSLTSGAIDRAIDTKKADNALERAKCEQDGGKWNAILGKCVEDDQTKKAQNKQQKKEENNTTGNTLTKDENNATTVVISDTRSQSQGQPEEANKDRLKENCEKGGNGTWHLGKCKCKNGEPDTNGFCPEVTPVTNEDIATNDETFAQAKKKLLQKYCPRNPETAVLDCGRKPTLYFCVGTNDVNTSNRDADVKLVCSDPATYISQQESKALNDGDVGGGNAPATTPVSEPHVEQVQIEQEQSYQPIAEQEITSNTTSIYGVIGTGSSKQNAIDNWITNAKDFMPKKYCSGGVLGTLHCPGENGNDSVYMTCSVTGFDPNIDYNDLRNNARIICANKQLREKLLTTPKYDTKTKTYSVQLNPTTPRLSCTEKLEILNIENIPAYTELRNDLYRDIYEQYNNKTATQEYEDDACTSLIHGRLEMDCRAGQKYNRCIPKFEEFIYCLADKQALEQYKDQQEKNNCRGL